MFPERGDVMISIARKGMPLWSTRQSVQRAELFAASMAIDHQATRLCAGLTEKQLTWSPRPQKWSIAQNLAHLRITTDVFLPGVDGILAASREQNLFSQGPFALSLYGKVITSYLGSRPLIKLKAPASIQPRLLASPLGELQGFLDSQYRLRQRIEAAEGLHLTALRFSSPMVSYLRVNLLEFFFATNAHAHHHLQQAGFLRQALLLAPNE
jgi:hypothetical protein